MRASGDVPAIDFELANWERPPSLPFLTSRSHPSVSSRDSLHYGVVVVVRLDGTENTSEVLAHDLLVRRAHSADSISVV